MVGGNARILPTFGFRMVVRCVHHGEGGRRGVIGALAALLKALAGDNQRSCRARQTVYGSTRKPEPHV